VLPFVAEERHEERVARQHPLARADQLVEQGAGPRVGIERGRHRDAFTHEHHGAGFSEHGFARIQRHDDSLQVIPDDLIVDFVGHQSLPSG